MSNRRRDRGTTPDDPLLAGLTRTRREILAAARRVARRDPRTAAEFRRYAGQIGTAILGLKRARRRFAAAERKGAHRDE